MKASHWIYIFIYFFHYKFYSYDFHFQFLPMNLKRSTWQQKLDVKVQNNAVKKKSC